MNTQIIKYQKLACICPTSHASYMHTEPEPGRPPWGSNSRVAVPPWSMSSPWLLPTMLQPVWFLLLALSWIQDSFVVNFCLTMRISTMNSGLEEGPATSAFKSSNLDVIWCMTVSNLLRQWSMAVHLHFYALVNHDWKNDGGFLKHHGPPYGLLGCPNQFLSLTSQPT